MKAVSRPRKISGLVAEVNYLFPKVKVSGFETHTGQHSICIHGHPSFDPYGRIMKDGLVQKSVSISPILAYLIGDGETVVQLDSCSEKDYHLLFQFEEVWFSSNWTTGLRDFIRGVSSAFNYPKVRVIKINNIRWILGEQELKLLKKVFPNLQKLEYVDNGSNDEEEASYKCLPLISLEKTKEILGEISDPFGW